MYRVIEWTGVLLVVTTLHGDRHAAPLQEAWHVVEELRIGSVDRAGAATFGRIAALEVSSDGRIFVLEDQANELRIFDADGNHLQTVGGRGSGPGEFASPVGMTWAPDGSLWVVDPENARVSVFDDAGAYLNSHRMLVGFALTPWPGGFDDSGNFYNYTSDPSDEFGIRLVLFDAELNPADTIQPPRLDGVETHFQNSTPRWGTVRRRIPFAPSMVWRLARTGDIWFARTDVYEIFRRTLNGEAIPVISRKAMPLEVTAADMVDAMASLERFRSVGGRVDERKIPDVKPQLRTLFIDDDGGRVWVMPTTSAAQSGRVLDVFDTAGRALARTTLPFALSPAPDPVFRDGMMYGVTRDEFDVPYVVRGRIVTRPSNR